MTWRQQREILNFSDIIQEHLHNVERWFGASAGNVGPGLQTSLSGFRVTSAAVANTFGTAIEVFDGTETPVDTGKVRFDMHRIQVIGVENNDKLYRLRLASNGAGHASFADAVAAGYYTEVCFPVTKSAGNTPILPIIAVMSYRCPSGCKVWAALASSDAVAQYLDFIVGIHEYDE